MAEKSVVAIDLGASSGRLISGTFDGTKIELKEQFRFSNQPIELTDSLYWDYLKIFQEIKYGLLLAKKDLAQLTSISVDTWGVDYGLIDHRGKVISAPHSYRDPRSAQHETAFNQLLTQKELFQATGVQPDTIDSVMQLFADLAERPFLKQEIETILFMPSLVEYFFSGKRSNDFTIASTSGLLDAKTRLLSQPIFKTLGFEENWFGQIHNQGKLLGPLLPTIKAELGFSDDLQVISGVGHDTAAAVMALPIKSSEKEKTVFISCGTWSIVGTQTSQPITNDTAFTAGLTNEGCFEGTNRLLKNITGLWIVQELQKEWSYQGEMVDYDQMVKLAQQAGPATSFIDPNDARFATPGKMAEKIETFLKETQQALPQTRGELLRIVYESLALSYAKTIALLEQTTKRKLAVVHMFGGGIKNQLLVQLTAAYTKKTVRTGPVEASVTGNIISQIETLGWSQASQRIELLNRSFDFETIEPEQVASLDLDVPAAVAAYQKVCH